MQAVKESSRVSTECGSSAWSDLPKNLEDLLHHLTLYGKVSLFTMDKGWYAKIEVFVTTKGVQFEVKSDFNCETPLKAVQQVALNLMEAFQKLNVRI